MAHISSYKDAQGACIINPFSMGTGWTLYKVNTPALALATWWRTVHFKE